MCCHTAERRSPAKEAWAFGAKGKKSSLQPTAQLSRRDASSATSRPTAHPKPASSTGTTQPSTSLPCSTFSFTRLSRCACAKPDRSTYRSASDIKISDLVLFLADGFPFPPRSFSLLLPGTPTCPRFSLHWGSL